MDDEELSFDMKIEDIKVGKKYWVIWHTFSDNSPEYKIVRVELILKKDRILVMVYGYGVRTLKLEDFIVEVPSFWKRLWKKLGFKL